MNDRTGKTFTTSPVEMNRRKVAFRTLLISLFVSAGGTALVTLPVPRTLILSSMGVIGACFLFLNLLFNHILERSKNTVVTVSDKEIIRTGMNKSDKCIVSSITGIRAKRTTSGQIREMGIFRENDTPLYVNGMEAPEAFYKHVFSLTDDKVKVHEIKEPIDYDHPLFYVFFGSFTGTLSAIMINLLIRMQPSHFRMYRYSLIGFLFAVCVYWFFSKPCKGRYGRNGTVFDYLFVFFLIGIGIMLGVTS